MKFESLKEKISQHRMNLHQIPEIGLEEVKTSAYVFSQLEALGYSPKRMAGTGVVAYKRGVSDECIAFRADMDGLSLTEETNLPFKSIHECHMHGCGHDGHMAILLGFAQYISTLATLKKGVLFVFQPAEEGPGGAERLIQQGLFKEHNIQAIFGLHLYPELEQGQIGLKSGVLTAQTGEVDIRIKGKSGHGAMPHTAKDAMIVAAQLINSYQTIISRSINPIDCSVITLGTIHGGERRNIIAEEVVIEGTIRTFSEAVYQQIKDRIREINQGLMQMYQVQIDVTFNDMYPPIMNDHTLYEKIYQSTSQLHFVELEAMMIAEDFAYYQKEVPGIFFMLGTKNEEKGHVYPLHSSKFNFDEEVLLEGVKLFDACCQMLEVYEEGCEER